MKIINSGLKFGKLGKGNIPKSIVLHHAAAKVCTVENIHSWHKARGWAGCGYHYFVRKDGSVFKGRPDYAFGAHCKSHNINTIGICFEGDFEVETMGEVQNKTGIELVNYLRDKYKLEKVYGHKELRSTACPGKKFPLEDIKNSKVEKYLRLGSKGDRVKEIQVQLQELGYYTGKIDSDFGMLTDAAVRTLQTKAGIKVDGVVGANTITAINNALKAKSEADEETQKIFEITKALQEILDEYGFECGPIDGDPGSLTRNGIESLIDYLY